MRARRTAFRLGVSILVLAARPALALEPARAIDAYTLRLWDELDGLPQSSTMALAQTGDT